MAHKTEGRVHVTQAGAERLQEVEIDDNADWVNREHANASK
jgi:hypothetical protein